jgi:hypothetical protein
VTNRFENRNSMQPIREGSRELSFCFSFLLSFSGEGEKEGFVLK